MSPGFGNTVETQDKSVGAEPRPTAEQKPPSWPEVINQGTDDQIVSRVNEEIKSLITETGHALERYCLLSLYEPEDGIDPWDSNRIFTALQAHNRDRLKDVLLLISSPGGRIEPAYQISKICKAFASQIFVVAVPRAAKSAATLIALGADQIHMGIMGELGPIDPQLGNLPALGVKRALETIAGICQKYPESAEAFARYMSQKVSIEQIGYCERVAESAVQYAERLLAKKADVKQNAAQIAQELVYEYKDHSFVIDIEEARAHLGSSWIISDSAEINFAEKVHQKLDSVNLMLGILRKKKLLVVGSLANGAMVWDKS
jgi:membrane-bound ClpP family serine protease